MSDEDMQGKNRIVIRQLPTGVPGLDEILGGGLPEYSFNIIAGGPGCGKTTLVHQILFANASSECPALYFTILGEPAVKMLRYQQQFSFFDQSKLDGAIRFVNLSQFVLEGDLNAVLEEIVKEVETHAARIVVVDSFRTLVRTAQASPREMELQGFVQRLALHMTSWQTTSFLVGEYMEGEPRDYPVFTVADGLLWLYQSTERNSIVRKMQITKMRGQASIPGLHTFRITDAGLQTFPRTLGLGQASGKEKGRRRISTGIPKLDALMDGGIPEFNSLLIAGPSGSGKSVMASQFIAEGLAQGEPGVVAIFEELPADFLNRASLIGIDFDTPQKTGALKVIYIR
ncbi:MAG TPA: ATPase domain-containing protein, partial [Candidatus Baltobacteraceae bacterium]|nr:ATPase domain-containing protein [Candidatus Baltobacteraceae bacterium]